MVQSDFGFHIIRLTGVKASKSRPFDEVKGEIAAELKRNEAAKKFAELVESFTNTVYEQADSLKPAADALKLKIEESGWLLRGKIGDIVKREANAMLAARLDFEKLDISLLRHFPRASLDLKGLTLVGEEPFAGDTIVAAQRISVVVNVMSLFGDEGFEVTKIILSEPALHAHKLADGRVNWDVVKASEEAQGEEEIGRAHV